MIQKNKSQRIGVFIDTANLYHSARGIYGAKVNFAAVAEEVAGDRQVVRCIAYVIESETGEEKAFFEALKKSGIELRSKKLQVFSNGAKKGDWDVGLAIDAVRLSPKLDVVVIISGDGDYVPLVEYLRNQGCQVEVASFGRSTSSRLVDAVDNFIDLDEIISKVLIGYRNTETKREQSSSPIANNNLPTQTDPTNTEVRNRLRRRSNRTRYRRGESGRNRR